MDEIKVKITEPLFHWRTLHSLPTHYLRNWEKSNFNWMEALKITKQKKEKLIFKYYD